MVDDEQVRANVDRRTNRALASIDRGTHLRDRGLGLDLNPIERTGEIRDLGDVQDGVQVLRNVSDRDRAHGPRPTESTNSMRGGRSAPLVMRRSVESTRASTDAGMRSRHAGLRTNLVTPIELPSRSTPG